MDSIYRWWQATDLRGIKYLPCGQIALCKTPNLCSFARKLISQNAVLRQRDGVGLHVKELILKTLDLHLDAFVNQAASFESTMKSKK